MRKFHLWFSLLGLISLGVGSYLWSDSGLFWLASNDMGMQIARGFLAILVLVQLFTEPPRALALRILTGLTAIGTFGFALHILGGVGSSIYDPILFMQTAIALGITALELPDRDIVTDPQTI